MRFLGGLCVRMVSSICPMGCDLSLSYAMRPSALKSSHPESWSDIYRIFFLAAVKVVLSFPLVDLRFLAII